MRKIEIANKTIEFEVKKSKVNGEIYIEISKIELINYTLLHKLLKKFKKYIETKKLNINFILMKVNTTTLKTNFTNIYDDIYALMKESTLQFVQNDQQQSYIEQYYSHNNNDHNERNNITWILIDLNGLLVGTISVVQNINDVEVKNFAIKPSFMKRRLGSFLFDKMERYVKKQKQINSIKIITTEILKSAISLYLKFGYILEGYGNNSEMKKIGLRKVYFSKKINN
jgi:ribosomal protein S18 acetylase RimI-like enzyme